jgi:hypothetical protein
MRRNEKTRLKIPEDRQNRFPIRFRRSEEPKSSPRLPRAFQVGILWMECCRLRLRRFPLIRVVQKASASFQEKFGQEKNC